MKFEAVVDLSEKNYESLQEAILEAEPFSIIVLENRSYHEGIHINKPLVLVGQDQTAFVLGKEQILIEDDVNFRNIDFRFHETKNDVHLMATKGQISCHECQFIIEKQTRPLYAAIWLEQSAFYAIQCLVKAESSFMKSIRGGQVMLTQNKIQHENDQICIEAHQVEKVQINDNIFDLKGQLLSVTKSGGVLVTDNTINLNGKPQILTLAKIEGIYKHEDIQFVNNRISGDQDALLSFSQLHEEDQNLHVSQNQFDNKRILLHISEVKGNVYIEENKTLHELHGHHIENLIVKENEMALIELVMNQQLELRENQVNGNIKLKDCEVVYLMDNKLSNHYNNEEAIFCQFISKLNLKKNYISSIDHGLTFLNGGDNLEVNIEENTFENCRKRALNVASTTQRKFVKTHFNLKHNIFRNNECSFFVDDQNLKSLTAFENYFENNRQAIHLIGGKSTSDVKLNQNYFSNDRQAIEIRNSRGVTLLENEMNNASMTIRGCDDILIQRNHFDPIGHHQIALKSGGYLSITQNEILEKRSKQAKNTIMDYFNVSAYDRKPAIKIQNNYLQGQGNLTYPDENLLEYLTYQIRTSDDMKNLSFDEALKREFMMVSDQLEKILLKIENNEIEDILESTLKVFSLAGLSDKESNDIYKLMNKGKETIAMLKMYLEVEDKDLVEHRIVNVLKSFETAVKEFYQIKKEKKSDLLQAQLSMLENYLNE